MEQVWSFAVRDRAEPDQSGTPTTIGIAYKDFHLEDKTRLNFKIG